MEPKTRTVIYYLDKNDERCTWHVENIRHEVDFHQMIARFVNLGFAIAPRTDLVGSGLVGCVVIPWARVVSVEFVGLAAVEVLR